MYIYTLTEDGSNDVRYVGQTVNLENRMISHLDPSKMAETNPKRIWIEDVLSRGGMISINAIEETTPQLARDREQYWIDYHVAAGFVLTNSQNASSSPVLHDGASAGGKSAKSYRFSDQVWQALSFIGESSGINETAIIEKLIFDEALRIGWKPPTLRSTEKANIIADSSG